MEGNFIVLLRKITEWEWYTDIPTKTLFLHLLLTANFKPNRWQGQTIKRGELITSVSSLSEQTGLSVQQVRTALNKLKSTGEISVKSTNRFTLVSVHNYGKYQDYEKAEQQTNNKRITNKQQTNNNTITKKQRNKETSIYMQCNTTPVRTTPELTGDKEYDAEIREDYERVPLYKFTPHILVNTQQEGYLYDNYSLEEVEEEAKKLEAYIVKHDAKPKNVYKTLCEWLERDRAI